MDDAKRVIFDLSSDGQFYQTIEQILSNTDFTTDEKKNMLKIVKQPISLLKNVSPDVYDQIENEVGEL